MKNIKKILTLALVVVSLLAITASAQASTYAYAVVPNGQYLIVRTSASSTASIKYYLPCGTDVTVVSSSNGYSYLYPTNFSYKGYGYAQSIYLGFTKPSTANDTQLHAFGDKTLQEGRFGRYTKNLQRCLYMAGYLTSSQVDGDFGPTTKAAVKSYQSGHGLTADGLAGDLTKASLWANYGADLPASD